MTRLTTAAGCSNEFLTIFRESQSDQGPAWCAIGTLGDAGYYAGADSRDELLALIQGASEMEGVTPTISMTTPTPRQPA